LPSYCVLLERSRIDPVLFQTIPVATKPLTPPIDGNKIATGLMPESGISQNVF